MGRGGGQITREHARLRGLVTGKPITGTPEWLDGHVARFPLRQISNEDGHRFNVRIARRDELRGGCATFGLRDDLLVEISEFKHTATNFDVPEQVVGYGDLDELKELLTETATRTRVMPMMMQRTLDPHAFTMLREVIEDFSADH
jgi:hypothetical protein